MTLLKECLDCSIFRWSGKHYAQMRGLAIGQRLAPTLAVAFMSKVEAPVIELGPLLYYITTVALLLDYRHNETRSKKSRNNIYWDMPSVYEKLKQATRGNTICAECQPEATLHRNNERNQRCASDLEDGEQGFWKLIGPKSCNGIWTRISRDDNCRCGRNHTELDPFLLV
uniref:Reverse transcriptase domain-containing protein n=1 Tax=Angiostrongylus cantonensis TaxID=6313 RepID=A0A0K0DP49_ANGCA